MQFRSRLLLMVSMLVAACAAGEAAGREPQKELLWPAAAPHATGDKESDKPWMDVYLPESSKAKSAVVVCPGGAYHFLALDHEGRQIAEWLNSIGVAAFVLHYRHQGGGYRHPVPLGDAQRAVRVARARALKTGLTDHVGILGFSAGGHLAASAATRFEPGDPKAEDAVQRVSSRPDFLILAYPVITMSGEATSIGSMRNLLGQKPGQELRDEASPELHVSKQNPPAFLMHTSADTGVLPENSTLFYNALRRHGVPAELHIYEQGPHGVGLGKKYPGVSRWSDTCAEWLELHGWATARRDDKN